MHAVTYPHLNPLPAGEEITCVTSKDGFKTHPVEVMAAAQPTKAIEIDGHIHSNLSVDGYVNMETLCERAIEVGLKEIAFTEHYDTEPADAGFGLYDYAKSRKGVERMREQFGDRLSVKLGIEVDYQVAYEAEIADFLRDKTFDCVLGARHWLDGAMIGPAFFEGKTEEEAYARYFESLLPIVECGLFDVLPHIDLVKRHGTERFGPFDTEKWLPHIEPILHRIINTGMGLEINTSGLREAPGEPYPGLLILERYRELGGRILTIGSDTHKLEHLGVGLEAGPELAKQAGFTNATLFKHREPVFLPL